MNLYTLAINLSGGESLTNPSEPLTLAVIWALAQSEITGCSSDYTVSEKYTHSYSKHREPNEPSVQLRNERNYKDS